MNAPVELELRLAGGAAALTNVFRARALAPLKLGPESTRSLRTVYWDTEDGAFQSAGIALRARTQVPGGHLLGVKIDRGEAIAREEIEVAAADDVFRFAPLVALGWKIPRALRKLEAAIRPRFHSEVERRTRPVTFPDGSQAELALDTGRLVTAAGPSGASEPIAEIEIELTEGDPRRIYELAFALVDELPGLRVLFASKAERGSRLLTGTVRPARKAREVTLARGIAPGEVVVRAAAEGLAQIAANLEGARIELGGAHVHQLRVGVRRYRMTHGLARRAGLPLTADALRGEFRALWDALGAARDRDVFAQTTWPAAIAHERRATAAADSAEALDAEVAQRRTTEQQVLRDALDRPSLQKALIAAMWALENQREAARRQAAGGGRAFARKMLRRARKRTFARGERLAALTPAERHRLRIEAKKLRYTAEFVRSLFGGKAERYLERLEALQDSLGAFNDLDVGRGLMTDVLASLPASARAPWSAAWDDYAREQRRSLDRDLERHWRRVVAAKPFWR